MIRDDKVREKERETHLLFPLFAFQTKLLHFDVDIGNCKSHETVKSDNHQDEQQQSSNLSNVTYVIYFFPNIVIIMMIPCKLMIAYQLADYPVDYHGNNFNFQLARDQLKVKIDKQNS